MTATPARAAPDLRVHAALVVVQVAFASQAVEGKILMGPSSTGGEGVSPFAVAMVRMLGAALFFQAFTRATGTLRPATRRDHGRLGIALNQTLFLVGLRMTSPANAALLSVTIPVFTAVIAVALGHERPSWRLGIGLATSIAGVVWLTGVGSVDRGALVILANCVSYSLYIVLSRATIQRLGTLTVVTWIFTWGALLSAPLGMPALVAGAPSWSIRSWGLLAYIVAMPTIVAYLCNAWALERSSPTLVSIYIYVQPVLAAVLAWLQLGNTVSERLALAAVVTAAGVTIVATRRNAVPVPMEE